MHGFHIFAQPDLDAYRSSNIRRHVANHLGHVKASSELRYHSRSLCELIQAGARSYAGGAIQPNKRRCLRNEPNG